MKTIVIDVDETVYALLEVLTHGEYAPDSVQDVVLQLIDHAQQGVYRPRSVGAGLAAPSFR
jgi:hypothetical protein